MGPTCKGRGERAEEKGRGGKRKKKVGEGRGRKKDLAEGPRGH